MGLRAENKGVGLIKIFTYIYVNFWILYITTGRHSKQVKFIVCQIAIRFVEKNRNRNCEKRRVL